MSSAGLISISTYFILNLIVTVTNKQLLFHTSSPYLLTASHAFTTFVATSIISRLTSAATPSHGLSQTQQTTTSVESLRLPLRTHLILVAFSLLYTVNIALSNLTLGLVSLPMHQTIRATAPAITVLLTVIVFRTPLRYYPMAVYLSLVPTICGVVVATSSMSANVNVNVGHDEGRGSTTFGVALTFLGAVLAVLKTMITHQLQKASSSSSSSSSGGYRLRIGIPPMTLVRFLSPYAVVQALGFACWTGEVTHLLALGHATDPEARGLREIGALAVVNMLSASALNVASFEANRRCGPLSMGVAGNLKQVFILVLASLAEGDGETGRGGGVNGRVVLGTLMTVVGGLWYAWAGAGAGAGVKARTHYERHGRGWGEADDDEQREGIDRRETSTETAI
ncbi:hypothetical protein LTR06_002703 [Exophiala xenobiotica]|nr:hypothetical protein LTR06_002703 [Exophiala xenobiotica]